MIANPESVTARKNATEYLALLGWEPVERTSDTRTTTVAK